MMAQLDEHRRPLRSLHQRRHELRDSALIRRKKNDLERKQIRNTVSHQKSNANANRDDKGGLFKGDLAKGIEDGIVDSNGGGRGSGGSSGGSGSGSKGSSKSGSSDDKGTPEVEKLTNNSASTSTLKPSLSSSTSPPVTTTQAASQVSSSAPPPLSSTSIPTAIPTQSTFSTPSTETSTTASFSSQASTLSPTQAPSLPATQAPATFLTLDSVATLSSWSMTASASQGRKGAEPGAPDFTSSIFSTISSSTSFPSSGPALQATAVANASGPSHTPDVHANQKGNHHKDHVGNAAAHGLIAVGIIGGLVILAFAAYLVLRILKVDVKGRLSQFFHRDDGVEPFKFLRSLQSSSWRPSFSRRARHPNIEEFPPPYEEAYAPEKIRSTSPRREIVIPTSGTTPLVSNPAPFGASSPVDHNPSAGLSYFITNPDRSTELSNQGDLERNISNASNNATYFGTFDPNAPRTKRYGSQNRQPSAVYGSNYRISELSSLSSGFGDAKIDVPESGPSKPNPAPASRGRKSSYLRAGFLSRFSWSTNKINTPNSRDTVCTMASEESSPRFRSVTSWVNQQTTRVQRQNEGGVPVEPVARRKPPVTAAFQLAQARASVRHSRQQSEDNAFRAHPGQEVQVGRGATRVASSILDGNFGGDEGPRFGRY